MKKLISLFLSGVLGVSSVVSGISIPVIASADETGGFTLEEIEASEVKPNLYITVDGKKGGKVFDLADVAGKTVNVTLDVLGANEKYGNTSLHIYYDKALEIGLDKFNKPDVKTGAALKNIDVISYGNDSTASDQNMKCLSFVAASGINSGIDGTMCSFDLKVPADAKAGDVYGIDIIYKENNSAKDLFGGGLMSAYTFTKGIYNPKYNNNFAAPSEDIAKCLALTNINKSYDGYIAIAGEESNLDSGKCGENLTWKIDSEGTLTISGTGDMTFTNSGNWSWENYRKLIKKIIINKGATNIGFNAFGSCTNLESITIPDSVTNIDGSAFSACTSLKSITIPDSVTNIDGAAFNNCTSLESITIPNSVTSIGRDVFSNCTNLKSITIPDSFSNIVWGSFSDCTSLESITLPDSVKNIEYCAFYNCSSLESISILNPKCEIYDTHDTISKQAVIKGYKGSTAEEYAKKYNRTFVALDNETPVTTTSTTAIATTTTTKKATTTTTTTTVKATTKVTTTTTTRAATTTTLLATTTTATTTQTTLPKDDIKEKFILKLMPLSSKTYETVADIKSIASTDNSVGVYVVSEDKRYLNITAANYGYAEITVELVNGDKYLVCLTVGYDTEYPETTTSTATSTTAKTTTSTSTTSTTTSTTTQTTTSTSTTSTTTSTTTQTTASTSTTSTTTSTTTQTTASTSTTTTTSIAAFEKDEDTWNFNNKAGVFWEESGLLLLENELEQLEKIKDFYNKPTFSKALDSYIHSHSGSCYGMTTLALISYFNKEYYLPLIQEDADSIKSVKLNDTIKSIINYYSSLQLVPEIRYTIEEFMIENNSEELRFEKLFELIEKGPALVCYRVTNDAKGNTFSHAVIAYDIESYVPSSDEDAEFFNNLRYTPGSDTLKMIKVYDPNYLEYSEEANIFVNVVEESGKMKYYWGIKEHFAYNKKQRNKEIFFVSNDTELFDRYGLFNDEDGYKNFDPKYFFPELLVNSKDKEYTIIIDYDKPYIISAPIADDEPYVMLPSMNGDSSENYVQNYALKYNNLDYKFMYDDNQYKNTELKMQYAETLFDFDSSIKAASFSQNTAVYEVKKNSSFKLTAISDRKDIPDGFYEITISGILPANGFIRCDYDAGLWYITSSVPLSELHITATNGTDCIEKERYYTAKNNKITIQHSNLEKTKIKITEDVDSKILLGDVNNDGQINSSDASSVLAYYAKISTNQDGGYTESQKLAADVNDDGSINSIDASKILAYYAYVSTTKEDILSIEEFMQNQ